MPIWLRAGTDTRVETAAPPAGAANTVPLTARAVALVRTSVPSAPPPAPLPPTQNHAEDSASEALTAAQVAEPLGPAGETGEPERPTKPSATAVPATTTAITKSNRRRRPTSLGTSPGSRRGGSLAGTVSK